MSTAGPPEIRGMLGPKGDSMNWQDAVSAFPNGVPRFDSRADCLKFMQDYNTYNGGSNPEHPHMMHIFTMLISWHQIEKYLLPNIEKARQEYSEPQYQVSSEDSGSATNNVYEKNETSSVREEIEFRLNLPIHRCTTATSTIHTLRFLFFHMKCGIFVMIRNGQLRIFAPFVNKDYRNTWGDQIKLDGDNSLDTYYSRKAGMYREEHIEKDRFKWWANGNIICNELTKPNEKNTMQYWGDHFLAALRDLLGEACRTRTIPDCEFFINKRDYPQMKFNVPMGVPVEPYGFIFDKDDRDPAQVRFILPFIHLHFLMMYFFLIYCLNQKTKYYQ